MNKYFYLLFISVFFGNIFLYAEDKCVDPRNILDVVTEDWNGDGFFDRSLLLLSESNSDETTLLIYLSNPDASTIGSMRLAVEKKNIAWVGSLWGTTPSIQSNAKGSLVIKSTNDSIGRSRWTQKITIAYRHNRFIVAGYSYSAYDTIDPKYSFECDINLFTGHGFRNGKSFVSSSRVVAIEDWSEKMIPKECQ